MKLLLLAAAVAASVTAQDHKSECETIVVRGIPLRKEALAKGLDRPYQLSIYRHEQRIFFSYNIGKNEEDTFEIAYIKKGEKGVTKIPEVTNGFATAVDEENHHVYLGGGKGIYKYHLKENNVSLITSLAGHNIWYMFIRKHHLYFIAFPSQKLYRYETNATEARPVHQKHITEKIYQFVIDNEGDQFITTDNGVYRIKEGSNDRQHYSNITLFRGVALNTEGHVYFCGNHSIYKCNKTTHSLEIVAKIRNVFGITFDQLNNLIYSDPKKIVKLVPGNCK